MQKDYSEQFFDVNWQIIAIMKSGQWKHVCENGSGNIWNYLIGQTEAEKHKGSVKINKHTLQEIVNLT